MNNYILQFINITLEVTGSTFYFSLFFNIFIGWIGTMQRITVESVQCKVTTNTEKKKNTFFLYIEERRELGNFNFIINYEIKKYIYRTVLWGLQKECWGVVTIGHSGSIFAVFGKILTWTPPFNTCMAYPLPPSLSLYFTVSLHSLASHLMNLFLFQLHTIFIFIYSNYSLLLSLFFSS